MADFTAADIKRLRELTGAGMTDCKNALVEAAGIFDQAVDILRVKGAKDVGKRLTRIASNGLVAALVADDATEGSLVEVNCETDFVAKTAAFQELGANLVAHIAAQTPADVEQLLAQPFTADPTMTVGQALDAANAALGEKVEVRRFARLSGRYVAVYLHRTNPDLPPAIGVLVQLSAAQPQVARDIAQHIAAMAPRYVSRDEVPEAVVADERRIAEETARAEGKPEAALAKIVDGRLGGFFKDATLLEQAFVKDNKKTIQKVLDEAGVTVQRFARFRVGQA